MKRVSKRTVLAGYLAIGLPVLFAMPARALAYCSEPSAPYCASSFGPFTDEWDFRRCKSEMESYQSDVETFIGCNNREAEEVARKAQRDNGAAISSFNDAVESFNRRAGR